MNILLLDRNHDLLKNGLLKTGFKVDENYTGTKQEIEKIIDNYDGIIIRSRFPIDKTFLDKAQSLKFIGRVGAGLENIDVEYAQKKGIKLYNAPEGNRNAVGEHTLGLILNLFNRINIADNEVRKGIWKREENRGVELDGKTVGIIGYGNMGKAFAKKLRGFDVEVIAYDIKKNVGDENAKQVSMDEFLEKTDVLSLHVPQTPLTDKMINKNFINRFYKNFWLINTARGTVVDTGDLVEALESGKILGAGLDVLEYEKSSFENMFENNKFPPVFEKLIQMQQVVLTPHIAGWTQESKVKLAETILHKILKDYK
jgi:D-3-phosphoglycerate dehydrogenase